MRPSDDPNFFRLPPPPGRSRESTIVLDNDGHFLHDDERFGAGKMETAFHTWIRRHPDDGRWILSNGYDWSYFTVLGTPFFVRAVEKDAAGEPVLRLSDGTEEPVTGDAFAEAPAGRVGSENALYVRVKRGTENEALAKFDRHAQLGLAPWLAEENGRLVLHVRGDAVAMG